MRLVMLAMLIFLAGCTVQEGLYEPVQADVSTTLLLTEQDLSELGMEGDCRTEEYQTSEFSPLAQYSFCNYTLDDTEIVLELKRFTTGEDLNGTYQYESSHLRSAKGLISEDTYGDQSRFSVNTEDDYGGQYNDPAVFYYHLWIVKDAYLIHITSRGREDVKDVVEAIGAAILAKFEVV